MRSNVGLGMKSPTLLLMTIRVSHPDWANGTPFAYLSGGYFVNACRLVHVLVGVED
jgi:hypothetical protein